ncbi:high-affinity glucose transporter 1 [Diutina catenulata]
MAKKFSKFLERFHLGPDHSPPEIYNWTLYMCMFVFGILGSARGYDEGNIAGSIAQKSFKGRFIHSKGEKSNITSMVQLGSIPGAMFAMFTVDYFGRVRCLQGICVIWIVGTIIQLTSKDIGQLYAGRFIEGLAIGHTTTIGPTYISEVAPARIRGRLNSIFSGAVYIGYSIATFTNYGTALHISNTLDRQWIIPTSLKIVLAGGIGLLSFIFCIESPRWYIKKGKHEEALKALSKLRHLPQEHAYILSEIDDINEQVRYEKEVSKDVTYWDKFKSLVMNKSIRYRFFVIGIGSQLLGQWSGSNAISIYSTELFGMLGAHGTQKLKWTGTLGIVKMCSAYLGAFFLIDIIGRRRSLYTGLTIQGLSILYFAIFMTIVPEAAKEDVHLTGSRYKAAQMGLASLFLSGTGWTIGFNNLQYLLGSEVFPLNMRSFAQSLVMVFHFANQYGNSKATPEMMAHMKPYGAMYFFVAVVLMGLTWCYFFVPDVAGRSLESMEEIFNLPWYLIGRKGTKLCPDHSLVNHMSMATGDIQVYDTNQVKERAELEQIEDVKNELESGESKKESV